MDAPTLQVWKPTPGSWQWATLPITDCLSLDAEIRHLDFGSLSFSLPAEHEAVAELTGSDAVYGGRLVTVEWKEQRFGTFSADRFVLSQEPDGRLRYELTAGPGALEFLTWPLVWPNPASAPANQTREADFYPSATTDGPAETVVQYYIAANFRDRWAAATSWTPATPASQTPPVVAVSLGRGNLVRGRGRYQSLWQLVEETARVGDIGVATGLVNVTPVSAQLTVSFYVPVDRSLSARFSTDLGTIRSWEYAATPPTVTRTLAGRTDFTAGLSATNARTETTTGIPPGPWAGHREQFVPTTSDTAAFDVRDGLEELAAGRAKATFDLEVVDGEGMEYGVDYFLADTVGVDVGPVAVNDTVSAVLLSVTEGGGVRLRPIIGDPDSTRPLLNNRQVLRALTRRTNNLERR